MAEPVAALLVSGVTVPMSVTADGLQMLLKINKDLYISRRSEQTAAWGNPQKFQFSIPLFNRAVFAPDGSAILIDATYSLKDVERKPNANLYYCLRQPDGNFEKPRSLGKVINTAKDEINPYLCADGKTLFFCSNGHHGFGKFDVLVAHRQGDSWTSWSTPENLGCEINGVQNQYGFTWVFENGQQAFFTDFHEWNNETAIWQTELPAFARPAPVSRLNGLVVDKTGKPVQVRQNKTDYFR